MTTPRHPQTGRYITTDGNAVTTGITDASRSQISQQGEPMNDDTPRKTGQRVRDIAIARGAERTFYDVSGGASDRGVAKRGTRSELPPPGTANDNPDEGDD